MIETTKLVIHETAIHQFHLVRNLFANTARLIMLCEFVAHSWSLVEHMEDIYFILIKHNILAEYGLYKSPGFND